ncbi:MAG: stage II sporulation protein E [Clostridiales bacterium]|nr:stage II sporulation protein E [Clostridiales bacterium]
MRAQAIDMQDDKKYQRAILRNIVDIVDRSHLLVVAPIAFLLGKSTIINGGIPFGAVMFCGMYFLRTSKVVMFLMVLAGLLTKAHSKYLYINMIAIIAFMLIKKIISIKEENELGNALLCTLCIALGEYIFFYREGMLLYDFVKILFHLVISIPLYYICKNAGMYLVHKNKYLDIRNEEIMSVASVCAIAILGVGTLNIFGLKAINIIVTVIICMFSNKFGLTIGATFGMVLGIVVNIHSDNNLMLGGLYSFSGMLAGTFKSLGKVGTCLGFFLSNFLLMVFSSRFNPAVINIREMIVGMTIFILVPEKLIDFLIGKNLKEELICWKRRNYNFRLKEFTVGKLKKFSLAFKELQKTFCKISEYEFVANQNDISVLFDRVADRVCKNCSLCVYCWERSFYETYQVMYKMVEMLENRGRIEISDIPQFFLDRCDRVGEFTRALSNIYEIFKVDVVWKNKIAESRKVVSQQLGGLSKVILDLASEVDVDVRFNTSYEEIILDRFGNIGIQCIDAMVYQNKWGKYEVVVTLKMDDYQRISKGELIDIINDAIQMDMVVEKEHIESGDTGENKSIKLIEKDKITLMTGYAKVTREGQNVSGDSYSLINSKDGKFYIVISDGMGSGEIAQRNSDATINLFENFIESGFDKETAIKIINSILVLKSNDESFSTLDISSLDTSTGECEFIKFGAMPTFIKSKDGVKEIKHASLPAGILSSLVIEPQKEQLKKGDYIIMITDGVIDSLKKLKEKKLLDILTHFDRKDPKDMAKDILGEACCDEAPMDDMLVVVAKVG